MRLLAPALCLLYMFTANCFSASAQIADGWYTTDSLLSRLSRNKQIKRELQIAGGIYTQAHIDTANISEQAFKIAFLEKWAVDKGIFRITGGKYKKKQILSVVDYTKLSNARRFITIDLLHKKILYDTLVAQGSGRGERKNDKYCLPVYFSNEINSECSSPGLLVATKGTHPDNPCHLCKYTLAKKHDCVAVLEGLERNINDHILPRDVVVHTTGSLGFNNSVWKKLHITDTAYRVIPESCECCLSGPNGNIRGTSLYASDCGLAENGGYIGQSNGCLALPEEQHIGIIRAIKNGSLIFIYTNVIKDETNYFRDSPIIKKLIKMSK